MRHAAPTMSRRAWRPADLARLATDGLRLLAVAWLVITLALAACAVLPRLAGWTAAVVVSGSMQPAIGIGDLVLADPGSVQAIRAGQVVLVRRQGFPGQLLTHRVARVLPDGTLVTRGDANQADDPDPVPRRDVVGVVRMVVPQLGRTAMLTRRHDIGDLIWTGLLLVAAVVVAVQPRRGSPRGAHAVAHSQR